MTREDIVSMVQEVIITNSNRNSLDFRLTTLEQIEHFAALVAEREREACAQLVVDLDGGLEWVAKEIRARGQE